MGTPPSLQSRLTLRFFDDELERAYLADHTRRAHRGWSMLQLVCFAVWSAFALWDAYVARFGVRALWTMRLVGAPFYVGSIALGFLPRASFARIYPFAAVVAGAAPALAVIAVLWILGAPFVPYAYVPVLLVTLIAHTTGAPRFVLATVVSLLSIAAYSACVVALPIAPPAKVNGIVWLSTATVLGMFASYYLETYSRRVFAQRRALQEANARADALLCNILPSPIADRLKAEPAAIADYFDDVTVLFGDLVGFTPLAATLSPGELIRLLNRVFSEFDAHAEALGLEKIKTVGDAYMVAAGLPSPREDHAEATLEMARRMIKTVDAVGSELGLPLRIRIGAHSGPVVAGVIGKRKFSYDLWGDTVNTASRMESHGVPGAIQVSAAVFERLRHRYAFDARGPIEIKGKGMMDAYLFVDGPARSV